MSEPSTSDLAAALGLLAVGELSSFERLSTDAQYASSVHDSLALARLAAGEVSDAERLLARITEVGGDAHGVIGSHAETRTLFRPRITPRDWYESLMTRYVFDAIVLDVTRAAAQGVDPGSGTLVPEVLDDTARLDFLAERLSAAVADDAQLGGRLALWGRRLVGEAMGQGQRVLDHAVFAPFRAAGDTTTPREEARSAVLSRATANHSRRMSLLGLVA